MLPREMARTRRVVDAYLIAFCGLLLLAGRLGDVSARRTIFLVGLGVFTAASLVYRIMQTQAVLIRARRPETDSRWDKHDAAPASRD
jgi:hypothetical protein